jgi:N-acetylmuramoyl-L-alanine amidase
MTITRVITDVPKERVAFVISLIQFDGGTVQQEPEADGEVTIIATFADQPTPSAVQAPGGTPEFPWMAVARGELNVTEQQNGSNPRIETYHSATDGKAESDSVPWCSSFVNFCVKEAGLDGTKSKAARSWLNWGVEASEFVPGCIVVLKRGSPPAGHVGFFVGSDSGRIQLLGGNQGDKVSIAAFDADRVMSRRVPAQVIADLGLQAPVHTIAPGQAPPATARSHDVDTLARTIWGEARGGSPRGMEAVAAVVVNRLHKNRRDRFGGSIAEVCTRPQQFSCWNVGDPNLVKLKQVTESNREFLACLAIAERAVSGRLPDPTMGSDHYHTEQVSPDWYQGKSHVVKIDDHLFYNNID